MSEKKFTLLGAVADFDTASVRISTNQDSNFELCFICQEPSEEQLVCPATNSTRTDKSTGYLTLVQQLKQFGTIGELPISISSRVNYLSCNDLLERYVSNEAKFHKKCRNKYDKQHYDRASKKIKLSSESVSDTQPKIFNQNVSFVIKKTQPKT